MSRGIGGLDD